MAVAGLLALTACETDPETVAEVADEAGMLIQVTASSDSSILGTPAGGVPLEDAEVSVTNAALDMTISMTSGSLDKIAKLEIVKSFNGGSEVILAETTTLPYNLVIQDLDGLLAGTGVVENDLRIGNVLAFRTRITQTDGDVYYYNSGMGNYEIIVNCSSNLTGNYAVISTRDDGNTYDQGIEAIVAVSPGYYKTVTTGGWAAGTIAPDQGFNFQDTCNTLTVPNQDLAQGYYSNDVTGRDGGEVLANGDLVINYTIDFSAGARNYSNSYVKQP